MNVLVIGAHPDDEVLGVGGTIVRHVQAGDRVYVYLLTDGHTSRYNDPQRAGEESVDVVARRNSAVQAAAVLGVKSVEFARLADQRLDALALVDVVKNIEHVAERIAPEVVYTHHRGDVNSDHRVAFTASMTAFRSVGSTYPRRLLCYETVSSTEWSGPFPELAFAPNLLVDISAVLERKIEAMRAYAQELRPFPHPRSLEGLRLTAARWGSTVGTQAAEAFVVVREVWRDP
jgi:LmbE family N-acetylglucosaminyl deacetylase